MTRKYVGKFKNVLILCCSGLLDEYENWITICSHLANKKAKKKKNSSSILVEKSMQKEINERLKKLNFGKGDLISETFSLWLFPSKECAKSLLLTVNLDCFFVRKRLM